MTREDTGSGSTKRGVVVCLEGPWGEEPGKHERLTRQGVAQRLAALQRYDYDGDYDESKDYAGPVYFVPAQTIVGLGKAHALGIRSERDIFGGVVAHAFVGTKTITHPLIEQEAYAPDGWSHTFAAALRHSALPGYAAFTRADASKAGVRLLNSGPVRVKASCGVGGQGQFVVENGSQLEEALGHIDELELSQCGVALEQNLVDVTTYSVGQVCVAEYIGTYVGTQSITHDNAGKEVYGGSSLTVVNGDFDLLLALQIGDMERLAIERARVYDAAARECFPGFFASRRNYDVIVGRNCAGQTLCGVLEQSWRIGGASSAEVAALELFAGNPAVHAARAQCREVYGNHASPPESAVVYFSGLDPVVGHITKYTAVAPYDHPSTDSANSG